MVEFGAGGLINVINRVHWVWHLGEWGGRSQEKRWQEPKGWNGDQAWLWTPAGSHNQNAFTSSFSLKDFLRIGPGIPAFSLRPVKFNFIYWFDAVNIPFLWIYPCFDLLSSVANCVHVTNSCLLKAVFVLTLLWFSSLFFSFLNMSSLQNENGLHTIDSLTLVVYVKPGKSIKDLVFCSPI